MKSLYTFLFILAFISNVSFAQTLNTSGASLSNGACPLMEVNITTSENSRGLYIISFCNHGNAIATDASINVVMPEGTTISRSSIPFSDLRNTTYTFQLEDVAATDCGEFKIEVVSLGSGINECTEVHIFPNNPCQAMIDYYISNNTSGSNNSDNHIETEETNDFSRTATIPTHNYVFEDNVILNTIPSADSILNDVMLINIDYAIDNNNTANTSENDKINGGNAGSGISDIDFLFTAKHCTAPPPTTTGTNGVSIDAATELEAVDGNNVANNAVDNSSASNQTAGEKADLVSLVISVSPNPFRDYTVIKVQGVLYNTLDLQVVDVAGRTVRIFQAKKQEQLILNRGNLLQGVYFYRLMGDGAYIHTGKLIVQ